MIRFIRNLIIVCSSCIFLCPLCLALFGYNIQLICIALFGMFSVSAASFYVFLLFFDNLCKKDSSSVNISKYLWMLLPRLPSLSSQSQTHLLFPAMLEQEISMTASIFHSQIILPWYSFISPDDISAIQITCVLEDLFLNISNNVRRYSEPSQFAVQCFKLYMQHYRYYCLSLKKETQDDKDQIKGVASSKLNEDNSHMYVSQHPALRCSNGIPMHCQHLVQALLLKYLPPDVSKCELLFLILRDIISHNLLEQVIDKFGDVNWVCTSLLDELEAKKDANTALNDSYSDWKEIGNISRKDDTSSSECISTYDADDISRKNKEENFFEPLLTVEGEESISKFKNTDDLVQYIQGGNSSVNLSSDSKNSIRIALGSFISTTAVPLLPDVSPTTVMLENTSASFVSSGKMWGSPSEEKDISLDIKCCPKENPFKKSVIVGLKEEEYNKLFIPAKIPILNEPISKQTTRNIDFKDDQCLACSSASSLFIPGLIRSKSSSSISYNAPMTDSDSKLLIQQQKLSSSFTNISSLNKEEFLCSDDCNCFKLKTKAQLVKMNSFDKDDGMDSYASLCSAAASDTTKNSDNVIKSKLKSVQFNTVAEGTSFKTSDIANDYSVDQCTIESGVNQSDETLDEESCESPSHTPPLPSSPSSAGHTPGFGWENTELSPIYEESENLASTIAKLRCLLSERESQHSLGSQSSFGSSSESEPRSAHSDPGRYSMEKSRFTFLHKESSGSLASFRSTPSSDSLSMNQTDDDVLEASEVPLDGRVFIHIQIPETEVGKEEGGFHYTMYTIQYDAIYLCDSPIDGDRVQSRMILQTNTVRRRFREFLSLHSSLDENPLIRPFLNGIKGPNKWLNLPFSKLDSATIASRKHFLEKYLQALIKRPDINVLPLFKEFLAYGSDASVTFSKKQDITLPRLDRMFARTVSGVFHRVKTAWPNFDSDILQAGIEAPIIGGALHLEGARNVLIDRRFGSQAHGFNSSDCEVNLDMTGEEESSLLEELLQNCINCKNEMISPIKEEGLSCESEAKDFFLSLLNEYKSVKNLQTSAAVAATLQTSIKTDGEKTSILDNKNKLENRQSDFESNNSDVIMQPPDNNLTASEFDELFLSSVDLALEVSNPLSMKSHSPMLKRLITQLVHHYITHSIQIHLSQLVSIRSIQICFSSLRDCLEGKMRKENASCQQDTITNEQLENFERRLTEAIRNKLPG